MRSWWRPDSRWGGGCYTDAWATARPEAFLRVLQLFSLIFFTFLSRKREREREIQCPGWHVTWGGLDRAPQPSFMLGVYVMGSEGFSGARGGLCPLHLCPPELNCSSTLLTMGKPRARGAGEPRTSGPGGQTLLGATPVP